MTDRVLFGEARLPLKVHDVITIAPTRRVAVEGVSVVFVTEGWSRLEHAAGQIPLAPGSIVTIPEGVWVAATPLGYVHSVILYLREDFLASQLQWLPSMHPLIADLQAAHKGAQAISVSHISERGIQLLRPKLSVLATLSGSCGGELATLARVADLLDDLEYLSIRTTGAGEMGPLHRAPIPHRPVLAAARALHDELDRPWTIAELARRAAITESQLSRLFRQDLGISPGAYLWRARADRMAELLVTRDLTVAQAARAVGWADPSVASRAFRRRHAMSPRAFATRSHLPRGFFNLAGKRVPGE